MSLPENLANLEEIDQFGAAVGSFIEGGMDPDKFTATRLQMGVYGQRQEGVHMIRVKVPGGRLSARQLRGAADVVERFSQNGVAHITTRQDLQVYYVPLAQTPAALSTLASFGLTTREACGNTIRNITACPLAGICPKEHVDVTRFVDGAVQHFLRNPLNQQMPRKFKISFSGCEADCAQGLLHDLAVVAVRDGERFGFKVLAGGGLGHKPHEAIVVEPFVEERELLMVMEALVALHNRYSDRVKRAKARIKFLVDRFGPEGFVEKYREELAHTRAGLADRPYPAGEWKAGAAATEAPGPGAPRGVFPQKQAGLVVVPVSIPLGDLNAQQLRGLADVLDTFKLAELRTTQDQNITLPNVAAADVGAVRRAVQSVGFDLPRAGDNVVACPGTSTCRLGITSSTIVAPKLNGGNKTDLRIRVSGCHNGCAQPETGDIGIYGEGKRLHGKLVPHYQTYFGGSGVGGGRLALKGPSVPTQRAEAAIERVQDAYAEDAIAGESFFDWVHRKGQQYLRDLLAEFTRVEANEAPELARDHGDTADFRVLQLGGGECAGASQVTAGANFFEAAHERGYRDALFFQRKYAEAAKCGEIIARSVAQALVQIIGGRKVDDLNALAEEIAQRLPGRSDLAAPLASFAELASLPEDVLNEAAVAPLFRTLDGWTLAVADYCVQREPTLDLTGALPTSVAAQAAAKSPVAQAA
ncbi:MAG: nitrite/sulfite reductase [Betaproteobacteria bacterium]|nr:nitrite/sulfite reductase [Betaproteobacteria bacterium]